MQRDLLSGTDEEAGKVGRTRGIEQLERLFTEALEEIGELYEQPVPLRRTGLLHGWCSGGPGVEGNGAELYTGPGSYLQATFPRTYFPEKDSPPKEPFMPTATPRSTAVRQEDVPGKRDPVESSGSGTTGTGAGVVIKTSRALQMLEEGISKVSSSDGFRRYLAFTTAFHSYSARNQLLTLQGVLQRIHGAVRRILEYGETAAGRDAADSAA